MEADTTFSCVPSDACSPKSRMGATGNPQDVEGACSCCAACAQGAMTHSSSPSPRARGRHLGTPVQCSLLLSLLPGASGPAKERAQQTPTPCASLSFQMSMVVLNHTGARRRKSEMDTKVGELPMRGTRASCVGEGAGTIGLQSWGEQCGGLMGSQCRRSVLPHACHAHAQPASPPHH